MATGTKTGLVPYRKVGSGPDNKGLTAYTIASGYATAIGKDDPVKITTDGSIIRATNDSADSIGSFQGVRYVDAQGKPTFSRNWVAGTTGTNIEALVLDDPMATYKAKGNSPIPLAKTGDIFAVTLGTPDAYTGQSAAVVNTKTVLVGDLDISAITDLGENATGVDDNDAFTIRTSNPANAAVTITIEDGDGQADLIEKLNAVTGILAYLQTGTGFLVIEATDGYGIITAETTGTPFADLFAGSAGTFNATVAASAGMVKVINVIDRDTRALEVVLVDHDLRDDG